MIIESLSLNNFRGFYGEDNNIAFSSDVPTVIFATNGGGKSTILNAFTWALYDKFSNSLMLQAQIVNIRAIAESKVGDEIEAKVTIHFSHDNNFYVVMKSHRVVKKDEKNTIEKISGNNLSMQSHSGNGNWEPVDNPNETINRILPNDIHNYFFFDGERMEKMVSQDTGKRRELKNAANKLSGIEIIDRAIRHLNSAANIFEKELSAAGNTELTKIIELKKEEVKKVDAFKNRNVAIDKEQKKCDGQIEKLEKILAKNQATKDLQKKRDEYKTELEEKLTPTLNNLNKKIIDQISNKGYSFFTDELLNKCSEKIEAMRESGELPKGIKKQFVEDLLKKEECICHSALIDGSKERGYVVEWREKAGLEDVEERALKLGGQIDYLVGESKNSTEALLDLKDQKRNLKIKMSKIEEALAEISEKLTDVDDVDLADLERNRQKFEKDKSDMILEFNENTGRISEIGETIKKLEIQIQQIKTGQTLTRLAQKRLNSSNEAVQTLEKMLFSFQIDFKDRLQKSMQENFSQITTLPYYPVISDDFVVGLMDDSTGQPSNVGASTGEAQVLSVTFILGLVQEIRSHISGEVMARDDSAYPIVLDSPFGALGTQYRKGVAEFIPSIADQTIILVSETQWRIEVADALRSLNPKLYSLTYHNPSPSAKDIIEHIYDQEIPLQLKSDEFEFSSIKEF